MILKYLRAREWVAIGVCVVLIAFMVYLELEIPGYMSRSPRRSSVPTPTWTSSTGTAA